MKTLIWCQHSIGVGHLARAMQIADSMNQLGPVDLICGGAIPEVFRQSASFHLHQLRPVQMNADGLLMLSDTESCGEATLSRRRRQVLDIAARAAPDVLIVEMFPFGRKKLAEEIIALIEFVRERFDTRIVCSLRDVLITTRRDQPRFDRIAVQRLNALFDLLLIHGDPSVIRLEDSLDNFDDIRIPWHYTGYIARPPAVSVGDRQPRIIVSAGGGRVGQSLLSMAADSASRFHNELGLDTVLITGPHASRETVALSGRGVTLIDFVSDLPGLLASSTASISQCGYNTVTDILGAGVASVVVPYENDRENEQLLRAGSLDKRQWSVLLRDRFLNPDNLLDAVSKALAQASSAMTSGPTIALDGLERTRQRIVELAAHA